MVSKVLFFSLIIFNIAFTQTACQLYHQWVQKIEKLDSWVEITSWPNISIHVPYATPDNFAKVDMYCGSQRVFLHEMAANQFKTSLKWLSENHPDLHFHIWDGGRPLYAQEIMRSQVRGTPLAPFVSSPKPGGMHNYGMAIDLTLKNKDGEFLDMGSHFDDFSIKASARWAVEDSLLEAGELTSEQVENRRILRQAMRAGGFIQLPSEWWHFNAALSGWVRDSSGIQLP
ncbi:MAG: M15 family metallopeptidase [Fibrobacter sp.]|nr:M15 family metallopeptidase [Fibrobacter sp.]